MPNLPSDTDQTHKAGYVAIVGRPNVGKSTLLNQILGQKVAIVTPKPQTTRGRILGIHTLPEAQIVFIDTPGLHKARSALNKRFVQAAHEAIQEADLLLWLIDAIDGITPADRAIAAELKVKNTPICIVVNKIDRIRKGKLIPILTALAELLPEREIVPVSATTNENVPELMRLIVRLLPVGPPYFEDDTVTDQTERMLVQEAVREQVLLQTEQEVPYSVAVTIDRYEEREGLAVISATINVERDSQKRILVGQGGSRIREIGRGARLELEKILDRRVYLELFVRVQQEWTTKVSLIREFGL